MLADAEVPVRVPGPFHVDLVLQTVGEFAVEIGTAQEFVENEAVVNPLDRHLAPVARIEQFPATPDDFRDVDRAHTQQRLGTGEVDAGFLLVGVDLQQNNIFRRMAAKDHAPQQIVVRLLAQPGKERLPVRRDRRVRSTQAAHHEWLEGVQAREALQLDEPRRELAGRGRVLADAEVHL